MRKSFGQAKQAFVDHVHGDGQSGLISPLGSPRLQQEEYAGLHRELKVFRFPEQRFQIVSDLVQPCRDGRQHETQPVLIAQMLAPGNHILALRVELKVEIQLVRANRWLRVEATPAPDSPPAFPNTMVCTVTAVPALLSMPFRPR